MPGAEPQRVRSVSEKLTLKIETRLEELRRIATAVEALGRREGWSPNLVFRANLFVEEMASNVIDHGHDGGIHEFEIMLTSEPDRLTIEITDDGRPFDPTRSSPSPSPADSVEERTLGGLGLHLARTMVDEISYERVRGKNHVALVARREK